MLKIGMQVNLRIYMNAKAAFQADKRQSSHYRPYIQTMQLNHKNRRLKYLLKHRHQLTNFQAAIYSLMKKKDTKKKRREKKTNQRVKRIKTKKQTA